MKLKVSRNYIEIVPESPTDEAYLEEVLGLKDKDATAKARRVNAIGLSCWAYLRIERSGGDKRE